MFCENAGNSKNLYFLPERISTHCVNSVSNSTRKWCHLTNSLQICGYNLKTLLNNLQTLSCHQKYLSKCVNFSYFLTTPFSGKIIISFKQGESETTFADILLQCISKLSKFVNKKMLKKGVVFRKSNSITIPVNRHNWSMTTT